MSNSLPLLLGPAGAQYGSMPQTSWNGRLAGSGGSYSIRELSHAEVIRYCIRPKTLSVRVEISYQYATDPAITKDQTMTYEAAPSGYTEAIWDKSGPIGWLHQSLEGGSLDFYPPGFVETSSLGRVLPLNFYPILQGGKFYFDEWHTLLQTSGYGPDDWNNGVALNLDDIPPDTVKTCVISYLPTGVTIVSRLENGLPLARLVQTSTITLTITSQFPP